jgi:nephrocystin-3
VDRLYEKVLARWGEDYERDHPGLVREAMTLLWAARRGLSEAELLELLGANGEPMPHAHWSPFYLAAEASLVNRGGLLGFGHAYLRQAVENRYLADLEGQPDTEAKRSTHLRLADYFNEMDIGPRKVDELPWHLQKTSQYKRLHNCLIDLEIFENLYDREINFYDLFQYWEELELLGYDIGIAYKMVVAELEKSNPPPEKISRILRKVSFFLGLQDRYEIAILLMNKALNYKEKNFGESSSELIYYLNDLGRLYCSYGEFYKAEQNYRRALKILKTAEINNNLDTAMIMDNLGVTFIGMNDFKQAEQFFQKALTVREKILGPYDDFVARSLNNLGGLYGKQGKFYKAEHFFLRSFEITRKIYGHEHPAICSNLINLAAVYWDQGKYAQAEANYRWSLEIRLKFFGKNHVASDLNNLAKLYHVQGKYEEAKEHYESSLAILKPDYPLYKIVKREYEQMLIDEKTIRLSNIFPFLSVPFKRLSNFLSRLLATHTLLEIDYQNPESNEVDIKISDVFTSVTSFRKKISAYVRRLLFRRR